MDQQKIGTFLKALRKDKGMTQIELAEKLHVAGRTVSRWETGVCLPDLDILTELADLYGVDVREIIEGEKKMNSNAEHQTPYHQTVADYIRQREQLWVCQILLLCISGILSWGISLILMLGFSDVTDGIPIVLALQFFAMTVYMSGMYLIKTNRTAQSCASVLTGAFCAVTVSNLAILAIFFGTGTYQNWGLSGIWYCTAVFFVCFLLAGLITSLINRKRAAQQHT